MSIQTNVDELSYEIRQKINEELEIPIESKFGMGETRYIYPFEIDEDKIKLPFAYGISALRLKRPGRKEYSDMNVAFEGTPRSEQKEILKEAIQNLSRKGSVMISAFPGFGKCLRKDTPVMMYNGTIKNVQDVKIGDLLMGDDSNYREVLSTCTGQEQMYNIVQTNGDTFGCNESHILSLKIKDNKSISYSSANQFFVAKYFNIESNNFCEYYFTTRKEAEKYLQSIFCPNILDISVKEYLKLPKSVKDKLFCYKVSLDFPSKKVNTSPYFVGYWLGSKTFFSLQNMNNISKKYIPNEYLLNDRETRLSLLAGFIDSCGYYNNDIYELYFDIKQIAEEIVFLCRSLGFVSSIKKVSKSFTFGTYYLTTIYGSGLYNIPVLFDRNKASYYEKNINIDFLMSEFKVVPIEDTTYYGFTINGNNRFLLGDFTVTHNTACSIKLACDISFKTLVIVNKIVLIKQWKESIHKFAPTASVQCLTARSNDNDCDFYIVNAQNVEKFNKNFFLDIGTVIVDEAHMIMAETLSRSLQYIYPRYLIGLTATPYRPDGLNILLELYFGKYKIVRKLWREHTAYKITTGFKPTIEYANNGRVNWGVVLDSQANDEERNEMIIKLLKYFSDRNFLVLVKRISQGEYLIRRLEEEGEDITSLIGNNQEFDVTSRILIGTSNKVGVGFDHPRLNALLLASDIEEYFVQYLGRVFRTKEVEPIILDLVDDYNILNKHWNTRRKVYQDHGGKVKNFDLQELN